VNACLRRIRKGKIEDRAPASARIRIRGASLYALQRAERSSVSRYERGLATTLGYHFLNPHMTVCRAVLDGPKSPCSPDALLPPALPKRKQVWSGTHVWRWRTFGASRRPTLGCQHLCHTATSPTRRAAARACGGFRLFGKSGTRTGACEATSPHLDRSREQWQRRGRCRPLPPVARKGRTRVSVWMRSRLSCKSCAPSFDSSRAVVHARPPAYRGTIFSDTCGPRAATSHAGSNQRSAAPS